MDSVDRPHAGIPYIVELTWGRPNQAMVCEYADDGSLIGVTLIRSREALDPTRRRLCCTYEVWHAALAMGRRYGWMPTGTSPAARSAEAWAQRRSFENNYDPDGWVYAKQIQAGDASDLAAALERSLEDRPADKLQPDMTPRWCGAVGSVCAPALRVHDKLSAECLREIIAFLRRGPCIFSWADRPWSAPAD